MQLASRSDAELIRLAQAGASPAFAVLVFRHAADIRAVVANDKDPVGAVIATFVQAMRQLSKRTPEDPVRPWLLKLAAKQTRSPIDIGDQVVPTLDDAEADEIWAELDIRWPRGRVPRNLPRWVGWFGLVIALVGLAVLVPYVLLTIDSPNGEDDEPITEVIGRPYQEPDAEREPAQVLGEPEQEGLDEAVGGEGQA